MGVIAKSEWRGGEQKKLEFCKVDMPILSSDDPKDNERWVL